MSEVVWKTLVYHSEKYDRFEVSTDGRIRNSMNKRDYKTFVNKRGYEQVCVSLGSTDKKKVFKIHRAIAETFLPNPDNKPEVNHKDGDKLNNALYNLEWATGAENMRHASASGLLNIKKGTEVYNAKLTAQDVLYIRENYIPRHSQYGARALGRKFDVNHSTILDIINHIAYVNV